MSPARSVSSSTAGPGVAERRRPALCLQRQLEQRLVHAPVLLAGDLEDEDVVRVVVDRRSPASGAACSTRSPGRRCRAPPRARGRSVRAAATCGGAPGARSSRRPRTPSRDAVRVGHAGERLRPPGDVGRVVADSEIVPPSLTSRRPGVRRPPEETSRSTSATDRRSSKRPSSARGTASGRCSQYSARNSAASTGSTQRASASLGRVCLRRRRNRCRPSSVAVGAVAVRPVAPSPSVPSASPSVPSASPSISITTRSRRSRSRRR